MSGNLVNAASLPALFGKGGAGLMRGNLVRDHPLSLDIIAQNPPPVAAALKEYPMPYLPNFCAVANMQAARRCRAVTKGAGLVLVAALLAGTPGPGATQGSDILARINGVPLTRAYLDEAARIFGPPPENIPQDQQLPVLLGALIDSQLTASAATGAGLHESERFHRLMEVYQARALQDVFIEEIIARSVTSEDIRAAYEAGIAGFEGAEELRARHILVGSQEEARQLITELDAGADFAELARTRSIGPSAPSGGDLGYFTQERMVPQFAAAAFALEPGSWSPQPVETQFGWHVILAEDRRQSQPPPIEQMTPAITRTLIVERLQEKLAELRENADIEILLENPGPALQRFTNDGAGPQ